MLHPATQLTAWAALALVLQRLSLPGLAGAALPALTIALLVASRRSHLLLRRSRWLLLSIALLFTFSTPGEPLFPGVTIEGLVLAAEQGLRLVLMLVTLAVIHERLGNIGMLEGLYVLLAPLSRWRRLRERIVVRLLLVLEYVEDETSSRDWRAWLADHDADGPDLMMLPARVLAGSDRMILTFVAVAAIAWGML